MKEPDLASDYQEREVQAVYSVLLELGQVLGAYRDKFVIVGGAVPWLLLPNARPQHIGTVDIDLDLNVDELSEGEYSTLIEMLEKHGYKRGDEDIKEFQLRRIVKIDDGAPIPVLIDVLIPREMKPKKNKPKLLEGFRALQVTGGKIALENNVMHHFAGKMPDGRNNEVDLLVASLPALLVMKGYAIVGRDKKKDCYDVYFSIRNYEGGPEGLAEESKPLLADPIARQGYQSICEKFSKVDGFGPQTVRVFLEESREMGDMTPDQLQTDAFMQVSTFIKALGIKY